MFLKSLLEANNIRIGLRGRTPIKTAQTAPAAASQRLAGRFGDSSRISPDIGDDDEETWKLSTYLS